MSRVNKFGLIYLKRKHIVFRPDPFYLIARFEKHFMTIKEIKGTPFESKCLILDSQQRIFNSKEKMIESELC